MPDFEQHRIRPVRRSIFDEQKQMAGISESQGRTVNSGFEQFAMK